MTAPLVSVCMPAFNVGKFVDRALESILAQTYPNLEIVVVDDESSDETPEVVGRFAGSGVRYVRNERNLGGFQTMNRAMSLARGDMVAVYHSDDVYEPTIVEKEVEYLMRHPEAGAVFCLDHWIDDTGEIIGGTELPAELRLRDTFSYNEIFRFFLRHQNVVIRCPTFMTRRTVLEIVGSFDAERYDIRADVEMWLRILRHYPIGILNERLMRYRVGGYQWSTRYNYLRTSPELFFVIMDRYLGEDGWRGRLTAGEMDEYAFHRCDDETFRAINWLLNGDPTRAAELLRHRYPWGALGARPTLRKVRLLALRVLLWLAVRRHPAQWLKHVLHRIAYRRRFSPC